MKQSFRVFGLTLAGAVLSLESGRSHETRALPLHRSADCLLRSRKLINHFLQIDLVVSL